MRNKPRIRFKGFTEDWEQYKLEDICLYQSSSVTINDVDENGRYDLYDVNSLIGKTNKGFMEKEYITIIKDGAGVGRTRMLPKNSMFLGTMGALIPKNSNLEFLYQLVTSANLGKICSGSTIPHIYFKDYGKLKFYIPSIIEQEVIGKIFYNIDNLITLHQRKLEKLKLAKKALLQKLFPKNGSQFPEIRFKGFPDAWEQRKLDIATTFIGDGLHGTPKYDENGTHYFINGNNLVDSKIFITEETKRVSAEALSNDDRRLNSTAILMSINGTIGVLARYNNENIMLGKSVAYIMPKNINRDFLFYQLQGNVIQSYFYKNLTGTTIKNLGLGTIKNTIVMSTLPEEESEIGQFFYKLDQYITLHQRKLDKLKDVKKGLLQKMFV